MRKNMKSEGGVKAMRTNRAWSFLVILGIVLLVAGAVWAKIPEPDNIFYGPVSDNGQPVTSGDVTIKVNGSSDNLAMFSIGSSPNAGNSYILRVPMDSAEPQNPASARQGNVAGIYLNDQLAATVTLGPRGTVMKVPLGTCLTLTDFYPDADGDGYPGGPPVRTCVKPAGYKTLGELLHPTLLDCNDNNDSVHAGTLFYRDADGDGYGNPSVTVVACSAPVGYVSNNTDCNDGDPKEHPGQVWYKDSDGDGYSDLTTNNTSCRRPTGYKTAAELLSLAKDCTDNDASVNHGALEVCDKKDNDCDGIVDNVDNVDNGCPVGDVGQMSRNSHYLKAENWLIRAYSISKGAVYSVYLEVVEPGGTLPTVLSMSSNPLLVADDASAAGITLVFDENESAAYLLYSRGTAQEQVLSRIPINP